MNKGFPPIAKTVLVFLLMIGVFGLVTSCTGSEPALETEEVFEDAVNTAVAETAAVDALHAQQTRDAQATLEATEVMVPTETATITPTPEPPTPTATQQPPDISEAPIVEVSVDTNCRSGPGVVYPYIAGLFVGQQEKAIARNPQGNYWYITNPEEEGEFCWIWGEYATVTGDTAALPVYTPGPTPTPPVRFTAQYMAVEECKGAYQLEFFVTNTGFVTLESIATTVEDTVTDTIVSKTRTNFKAKDGCEDQFKKEKLEEEDSGYTTSPDLPEDPTGNLLFVTMNACTTDELGGDCREISFYLTP